MESQLGRWQEVVEATCKQVDRGDHYPEVTLALANGKIFVGFVVAGALPVEGQRGLLHRDVGGHEGMFSWAGDGHIAMYERLVWTLDL